MTSCLFLTEAVLRAQGEVVPRPGNAEVQLPHARVLAVPEEDPRQPGGGGSATGG